MPATVKGVLLAAILLLGACGRGVSSDPIEYRPLEDEPVAAPLLVVGAPGCAEGSDCQQGSCLLDVTGEPRCCERNCALEGGRVCSQQGQCVCSDRYEERSGRCRLRAGEVCETTGECASGYCADGVCCDGRCDSVCERCNALGQCVLDAEDAACEGVGLACRERGRCRLDPGFTCDVDSDCHSENCEPSVTGQSVCCSRQCDGICEKCGADGACGVPQADERCPLVPSCEHLAENACVRYAPPAGQACAALLECADCTPIYTRVGSSCGIGSQCNGLGECTFTGRGVVAAGAFHTCAVLDSGNVRCWGSNEVGQLGAAFDRAAVGDDETPGSVTNLELDFSQRVVQVATGSMHTCVLFEEGNVRCWGRRDEQVFGTEELPSVLGTNVVVRNDLGFVDPLNTGDVRLQGPAVQISAGWLGGHTCAVLRDGQVSCWGFNVEGQCGIGESTRDVGGTDKPLETVDLGGKAALEVRASLVRTCVLLEGGEVSCWGAGVAGYADESLRLEPDAFVDIGDKAIGLSTSPTHTCALIVGGRVRCWGTNTHGQLGYGHTLTIGDDETPAAAATLVRPDLPTGYLGGDVPGQAGTVQIVPVEERATCALAGTSVVCWGDNERGQLGYGHDDTQGTFRTPVELEVEFARNDDGSVIRGRNAGGYVDFRRPVLALADNGRCATVLDQAGGRGPLFCWGGNQAGELGLPLAGPDGSRTKTPFELGPVEWLPQ